MKKLRISGLILGVFLAVFIMSIGAQGQSSLKIITGPYLQNVKEHGITIMWVTNQPSTSIVEYGSTPPYKDYHFSKEDKSTIHEVTLERLKLQTIYHYRVISANDTEQINSDLYSFKTAVRIDSPFTFAVGGDNQNKIQQECWARITEGIYAERPDLVLNTGDIVTWGHVQDDWFTKFLQPAAQLMHYVPMYVSIGNHEEDAPWFYDYLSYPEPENYYSFDYGNAHFTALDSNQWVDLSPGSEVFKWLEKDLAQSNATWKFVFFHHPPYCAGASSLESRQLVPLFEKYGVDIVWNGHIHKYERTWPIKNGEVDPEGVIYIVTGGAGAELRDYPPTRSWFTAKIKQDWHYCLVTIHEGTLRMMVYDIDGRLFDYLELTKAKGGPKLEYSGLELPPTVNAGEPFNLCATVTNNDEMGGAKVELYVDGELVESKGVAIDPGKSEKVCFSVTLYELRDYEITIGPLEPKMVKVTAGAPF